MMSTTYCQVTNKRGKIFNRDKCLKAIHIQVTDIHNTILSDYL